MNIREYAEHNAGQRQNFEPLKDDTIDVPILRMPEGIEVCEQRFESHAELWAAVNRELGRSP